MSMIYSSYWMIRIQCEMVNQRQDLLTSLNTGGGKDKDGGLDWILRDHYETEMERKQDAKNCVWKSE